MEISKEHKKVLSILITFGLIAFVVSKLVPLVGQSFTKKCNDAWIVKDVERKYKALPNTLAGQEVLKKADDAIKGGAILESEQEAYITSYVEFLIRKQNGCEISDDLKAALILHN